MSNNAKPRARKCATESGAIVRLHLPWRGLDLHHLTALRQHETARVEDLPPRCRHLPRRELLAVGASAPAPSVKELHVRGPYDDRDREQGEQCVDESNAARTNHRRVVVSPGVPGAARAGRGRGRGSMIT